MLQELIYFLMQQALDAELPPDGRLYGGEAPSLCASARRGAESPWENRAAGSAAQRRRVTAGGRPTRPTSVGLGEVSGFRPVLGGAPAGPRP